MSNLKPNGHRETLPSLQILINAVRGSSRYLGWELYETCQYTIVDKIQSF